MLKLIFYAATQTRFVGLDWVAATNFLSDHLGQPSLLPSTAYRWPIGSRLYKYSY